MRKFLAPPISLVGGYIVLFFIGNATVWLFNYKLWVPYHSVFCLPIDDYLMIPLTGLFYGGIYVAMLLIIAIYIKDFIDR